MFSKNVYLALKQDDAMKILAFSIKLLLNAVIVLFYTVSCGNGSTAQLLDDVESYIRERPDSALKVLRSIDRTNLSCRKEKARFSLLHAMALDKNFIDTTDLSIIQPAVDYYSRCGSPEQRMRAFYYFGCIQFNRGDNDYAMNSFMTAMEDSANVKDNNLKGLINSSIAVIFSMNYNSEQELDYALRALDYSRKAADSLGIRAITGQIASCYSNLKMWEESERYYQAFFSMPIHDSLSYFKRKINYAKNYIFGPEKDYYNSYRILEDVIKSYPKAMTFEGYCIYAYALQKTGRESLANSILKQLDAIDSQSDILCAWRYRILRDQKKYESAISDLEYSVVKQDSVVIATLRQSLVQTQREYLNARVVGLRKDNEIKKQNIIITIVVSILAICILVFLFLRRKATLQARIRDLSDLQMEAQTMLNLQNRKTEEVTSELASKERALLSLRKQFASMYKAQYKALNDLCSAYWSPVRKDMKDKLYEEALRQVSIITNDKQSQKDFMVLVDKTLDNIIQKLRIDLPYNKEEDFVFLTFTIVGFDAKTISSITGYSVGTVYTKKNRLRHQISELNTPHRDFYLDYIT